MALVDRYRVLILDLDGTLVRGDEAIPGAASALEQARIRGATIVIVTNNATRTPEDVADRLRRHGVKVRPEEVVTSAIATAAALASRGTRSALVVGEEALRGALRSAGISLVAGSEPPGADGVPDAVVVGLDREATYADLRSASLAVQRGASFVATNADGSFPVPEGLAPGAGALVAAIETTTGIRAEVIGKPAPALLEVARERGPNDRTAAVLVVGDRLDTDIAAAGALGWDCLLVLTGVSRPEQVQGSRFRPTYVANDLRALVAEPEPPRASRISGPARPA